MRWQSFIEWHHINFIGWRPYVRVKSGQLKWMTSESLTSIALICPFATFSINFFLSRLHFAGFDLLKSKYRILYDIFIAVRCETEHPSKWLNLLFFSHYIINFQGEKKYSFQYLFSNWMWLMLAMYWIFVYISWYDHPNGANFYFSPSLQHWLCVRKTPTDTLKIYCNRLLNIY